MYVNTVDWSIKGLDVGVVIFSKGNKTAEKGPKLWKSWVHSDRMIRPGFDRFKTV